MKDTESYIQQIKENYSKNMQIKKEVWNKDIEIMIPHNTKVKRINEVQVFIIKLIYYLDYISITNLKTILSPIMNDRKADATIRELTEANLLKSQKKGYYGTFYYLSKYCLKLITGENSGGEYPLRNISNCTLESQDYRHLYLAETVIRKVLNRLEEVYKNMSKEAKTGYATSLFIENVSFDLMLRHKDRQQFLRQIGYDEKDIKRIEKLKSYSKSEREKYRDVVLSGDKKILGYDKYFDAYKSLLDEKEDIFSRYNIYYNLITYDKDFDYFNCIKNTIRSNILKEEKNGVSHNLIKYHTDNLRKGILSISQIAMIKNGDKPKVSETLQTDKRIQDYQDKIWLYNAICINLKRNLSRYIKKEAINEVELSVYQDILRCLNKYTELKIKTQKEYNEYKKVAEFIDTKAAINEEDRPIIYLKALELRNVFISNLELKKDKSNRYYVKVFVINIDRNKILKNFKTANLRRDYFGFCEMLKNIENELGIKIYIEYTYCYPEGSSIINYEAKFDKIFKSCLSNSNMVGADKFIIKELKPYVPYPEFMERLNRILSKIGTI